MASSARRRKTAWARTVRAATHSSCRSVAWSPSPSAPSRAAAALEILRRKPAAFGSQAPVVSATRGEIQPLAPDMLQQCPNGLLWFPHTQKRPPDWCALLLPRFPAARGS